jgi:Beta-galactosidase/beta-glucuronidase
MKLRCLALLTMSMALMGTASAAHKIDLGGSGWTFQTTLDEKAVPINVPGTWMTMHGYEKFIGNATYQRDFSAPDLKPGQVVRLHFDAVYDVAHVWFNGHMVGVHEGGYTPFEFDVTKLMKPGLNHILLEVDNTPTLSTIPAIASSHGSKDYPLYGTAEGEGIVGWMPYGGIVRPVYLLITDAVYLQRVKVDTKPDLANHTASIQVRAWVHNGGSAATSASVTGDVAGLRMKFKPVRVAANGDAEVMWHGTLRDTHLWSVRDPFLYDARVAVTGDELKSKIGVREIRVQGTQLLLNGRPVHLFGANRVNDDPKEGIAESGAIIERDMSDMLADNMRMMRIAHYPQPPALLDFADKHGMLIIAEAGNWNMSAWQMADQGIRNLWKRQMKEMMEQDWNHPSVIAWSMGNEYESYTKDGIDWTRDMRAYTLGLDPTRLITFASRFTQEPVVKTGKDEASQYSDFVSVNIYGNYAKRFDRVHELYPDKPVFVTEFGKMGEPGKHDPERIKDITDAVNAMKARQWMIGGSLWTWNDYRSLHRGTPASGIRYWGVVNVNREHRDSWDVVQKLFATELP